MGKWANVTSQLEIILTDRMRHELALCSNAERLKLRVKHSGYYDPGNPYACNDTAVPPEWDCEVQALEGEILAEDDGETPLSSAQIAAILDGGETLEAIYYEL